MPLSEKEILRFLMQSRERISAAVWLVVKDAHVAEDIFQNTVLKAITKDVNFEAEAALFSWAFITARRDSLNWFRKHRRESVGIDEDILILIHQDCHKIKRKPFHIYHQAHENKVSRKADSVFTLSEKELIKFLPFVHIVKRGDTIKSIAKKYGSKVKWIRDANLMGIPKKIKVGEKIIVPQKKPMTK